MSCSMGSKRILLFLHIPKTGGTTLSKHFYRHCCRSKHSVAENGYFHAGVYFFPTGFFTPTATSISPDIQNALARKDLRAVVGHFYYGIHHYISQPWTYVTVLRHPLERIISLYCHLKLSKTMTLENFARNTPYQEIDNDQTRRISGINFKSNQCTSTLLDKAKENLRRDFSITGTTERFDETLILIKRRFGWSKELYYFRKNVTANRPSVNSLSRQTIEIIRDKNRFDLELHSFANELLEKSIAEQDNDFYHEVEAYKLRCATKLNP